jgi:hypothetical protein
MWNGISACVWALTNMCIGNIKCGQALINIRNDYTEYCLSKTNMYSGITACGWAITSISYGYM